MDEPNVTAALCRLCLCTERALASLQNFQSAYCLLTGDIMVDAEALVCWECRAVLARLLKFRRQAVWAAELLKSTAELGGKESGLCLSSLKWTRTRFDVAISAEDSAPPPGPPPAWYPSGGGGDQPTDIKEAMSPMPPFDMEISPDFDIARIKDMDEMAIVPKLEPEDSYAWADTGADARTYEVPLLEPPPPSAPPATRNNKAKRTNRPRADKSKPAADDGKAMQDIDELCTRVWLTKKEVQKKRDSKFRCAKFQTLRNKCLACALSFHTDAGLRTHRQQLHCEAPAGVPCDICPCRAADSATLAAHRERHCVLRCRRCRYTTPHANFIRRHAAKHDTRQVTSCDACGKQFANKQHFYIHYKTHTSRQSYECDHCARVYTTRTQIFRHLRSHRKSYLCHLCGKAFSSQTYLNCHSLAHADPSARRFECGICHKRYINKFKLIVHTRFHTGEKPFECALCDRRYREKAQLTAHNKKYHSATTEAPKKRKFERTKSAFVNERFIEPKDSGAASEPEDKTGDPDKKAPSRKDKAAKTPRERKDFVCNFCGKNFKDKWRLKFHLAVHSDDRPYKCDECDLTFKYQSGLWTHKLVHKGDKPHQCTICGSQFTQKGNLTAHLKIHTDEKPFECNICGNKFRMRRNLRNHFRIHSNMDGCKRPPFVDKPAY